MLGIPLPNVASTQKKEKPAGGCGPRSSTRCLCPDEPSRGPGSPSAIKSCHHQVTGTPDTLEAPHIRPKEAMRVGSHLGLL